ncbi:MAG: hypothetical protein ACRC8Y_14950 [Chroococcales cyanobacterium]
MFERALTGRSHLEPRLTAKDGTPGEFGGLPGDREPIPVTSSFNPAQPRWPCQVMTRARVGHFERIRWPQEKSSEPVSNRANQSLSCV